VHPAAETSHYHASVIVSCHDGAATLDDTVAPGWLAALDRHLFVAARIDLERLNSASARAERPHSQTTGLSPLGHEPHCTHAGGATLGFHREVLDAVGEFDPAFAALEDTDYCVRAYQKGYELQFVPDAVYNYRLRDTPAGRCLRSLLSADPPPLRARKPLPRPGPSAAAVRRRHAADPLPLRQQGLSTPAEPARPRPPQPEARRAGG
jgi:hypothetical protein